MFKKVISFLALILTILFVAPAAAADVKRFEILKGRHYYQVETGIARLQTNNTYRFTTQVYADVVGDVIGSSISTPTSARIDLLPDSDGDPFRLREKFDEAFELENNYPNGSYSLGIRGLHDGDHTMTFTLTGDAYPSAPILNDYTGAQNLPYNEYNSISWQPFAGGAATDFIQFQIEDVNGNNVWETPDFGEAGALSGLATSTMIPANTLRANAVYVGTIRFTKVLASAGRSYVGVRGTVGYFARTEFTLRAISLGLSPVIDRLQLWHRQKAEQQNDGNPLPELPAWEFSAKADAITSNQVASIFMTLPSGQGTNLIPNLDFSEFEYPESNLTNVQDFNARFPAGPYSFDIARFAGPTEHLTIDYPSGSFPPLPNLQNLSAFSSHPATEDLNVSWLPWSTMTESDFIRVELFDEESKVWDTPGYQSAKHLRVGATNVVIPSIALRPGHNYKLEVHFFRVNLSDTRVLPGAFVFGGFESRTRFFFDTLAPDVVAFGIAEGQSQWQRGDASYEPDPARAYRFEATAKGAITESLRAAQVSIPNDGLINLSPDAISVLYSVTNIEGSTESLAAHYPAGTYNFYFDTRNDGARTSFVNLASTTLPPLPRLRNFSTLNSRTPSQDFDITWLKWDTADTNTDSIHFTLKTMAGATVIDSDADPDKYPVSATSTNIAVPHDTLQANKSYIGRLRFEHKDRFETELYPGARGSATVFSEVAFYLSTVSQSISTSPFRERLTSTAASPQLTFYATNTLAGRVYGLYRSNDLRSWDLLETRNVTTNSVRFTNSFDLDRAFFKTGLLP